MSPPPAGPPSPVPSRERGAGWGASGALTGPRWRRDSLLPTRWRGTSREATWRRARARRISAGGAVALAVMTGIATTRPAPEPQHAVMVAAHQIPAGQRLAAGDLRTVQWPRTVHLPAISADQLVGRVVVTPVAAGEPLTATRLRSARQLPPTRAGEVVVSIPAADPTLPALLRVGDRVDAWAGESGVPIGTGLQVVGTVVPEMTGGLSLHGGSSSPPAVLVAVPRTVAAALARAQAGSAAPGTAVLLAISPTRTP